MSNMTTISLTNVDKDSWKRFRGQALMNGWTSVSDWLRHFIKEHAEGKSNETK